MPIQSGWRSTRSDVSRLKRDLLCSESHPNPLNPLNAKEKGVSELLLGDSTVCSFDSESTKSLVLPYSDADFLEVSNQYGRFRHLFLQMSTFGDSGIAAFVHPYILSPFGSDDSQLGYHEISNRMSEGRTESLAWVPGFYCKVNRHCCSAVSGNALYYSAMIHSRLDAQPDAA
jgi:hypothetical protein